MIQVTEYFTNKMLTLSIRWGGRYLKIELNENDKLATFWLTNVEQEESRIQEQIQQKAAIYHKQKYTVAVFRSGKGNLPYLTEGLLLHNQTIAAHRDIEREQEIAEASNNL